MPYEISYYSKEYSRRYIYTYICLLQGSVFLSHGVIVERLQMSWRDIRLGDLLRRKHLETALGMQWRFEF